MQITAGNHEWDRLMSAMSAAMQPDTADQSKLADNQANAAHPMLARARSGCQRAQAALLTEHEDIWFRFCLSLLANPDAARDATQETALRVLRRLGSFRGDSAFKTWTLSIALNVCREQRRRRHWRSLPIGFDAFDSSNAPDTKASTKEDSIRLHTMLGSLPQRQREAVTLRYLHEMSTLDTAQAMRCAEGTVKATLAKALKRMRQEWGQDHA